MSHNMNDSRNSIYKAYFNQEEQYDGVKALIRKLCEADCAVAFFPPPKCYKKGCINDCPSCFFCTEKKFQIIKKKYENLGEELKEFFDFASIVSWYEPIRKAYTFNSLSDFKTYYNNKGIKITEDFKFWHDTYYENKYKNAEETVLNLRNCLSNRNVNCLKISSCYHYVLLDKNYKVIKKSRSMFEFRHYVPYSEIKNSKLFLDCLKNQKKKRDYYITLEYTEEDNDEI